MSLALSTCVISNSVCQKRLYYCTTVILGSINKCYVIFQVFMVDWQFTVFCREVGFVEIYVFMVLIFLAKNVSLLFLLLFASLPVVEHVSQTHNIRPNNLSFARWNVV